MMPRMLGGTAVALGCAMVGWAAAWAAGLEGAPGAHEKARVAPQAAPAAGSAAAADGTPVIGTITKVDLNVAGPDAAGPTVQVAAANGQVVTVSLDPGITLIQRGGMTVALSQLRSGSRATIWHAMRGGRDTAQRISLEEAASPAAPR